MNFICLSEFQFSDTGRNLAEDPAVRQNKRLPLPGCGVCPGNCIQADIFLSTEAQQDISRLCAAVLPAGWHWLKNVIREDT